MSLLLPTTAATTAATVGPWTKADLDAMGKALGITTTLTPTLRVALLQAQAVDRLASAVESLASAGTHDSVNMNTVVALAGELLAALPKPAGAA